jgi:hypothetical protein
MRIIVLIIITINNENRKQLMFIYMYIELFMLFIDGIYYSLLHTNIYMYVCSTVSQWPMRSVDYMHSGGAGERDTSFNTAALVYNDKEVIHIL